jgi:NAD(P)-dependent dehydrogenase (short-subunit alcohol dehydrogenase family)
MTGRLEGKKAIVVGGGQLPGPTPGNGRATAVRFAQEGAAVMVVDRMGPLADATVAEIREAGGDASSFVADVTHEDECRALARAALDRWSRVDVLHNNVGTQMGDGHPIDVSEEAWHAIIDLNLTSMLFTCKHILPIMREQRSGSIVNISSIGAVIGAGRSVAYCVSKAGVNSLTHVMANDNARWGVRVNAIMPGLIDTPMAVDQVAEQLGVPREELAARRAESVPLGRMGTAWDIANAALFLASDEAAFITGVMLAVDGGHTAGH